MNELALFAGAGGGVLAGHLLGWRTVCAVESDPFAASVLVARQNDETLPPFPVWDDVRTFDPAPWRGGVGVVSGGFPCQDVSVAGSGAGLAGARSGLWSHFARIVGAVQSEWVFIENGPLLPRRGLGTVLEDLAALGYDACWGVLGADGAIVGHGSGHAPVLHWRDRTWVVARRRVCADAGGDGGEGPGDMLAQVGGAGPRGAHHAAPGFEWFGEDPSGGACFAEHGMGRVAHGVAHRLDRLKCLGNGQVPAVAALAWQVLSARLMAAR